MDENTGGYVAANVAKGSLEAGTTAARGQPEEAAWVLMPSLSLSLSPPRLSLDGASPTRYCLLPLLGMPPACPLPSREAPRGARPSLVQGTPVWGGPGRGTSARGRLRAHSPGLWGADRSMVRVAREACRGSTREQWQPTRKVFPWSVAAARERSSLGERAACWVRTVLACRWVCIQGGFLACLDEDWTPDRRSAGSLVGLGPCPMPKR